MKRQPKLKSKYQGRVEKAIEYVEAIESWEDLVDPRTLAFYCLGPDPSASVLRLIEIEGKKSKVLGSSVLHQFFFKTIVSFLQK